MVKKDKPLTKQEIQDAKQILLKGRTRYENAIFEIEQIWNKLKPHDYAKRQKLIKAALGMADIDKQLRGWESKLSTE
ncbi:hypothetical protein KBD75_00640 [Candidatus Woesebacteria bacterium]|nr:hypothetical protein [Candidatus Woesebacteria bacterium]